MVDGKKLLVPIDGSGNSLRALAFVIKRITKDKKLRIYLLNVQLRLPSSLFVSRAMIAEYHESRSKEALARSCKVLAKHRVSAEIVVRIGEAVEIIVKFARHIDPDTDHGRSVTGHRPRSSEPLQLSYDQPAHGF